MTNIGRMKGGAILLAKHTNRLAVLGSLAFFDWEDERVEDFYEGGWRKTLKDGSWVEE